MQEHSISPREMLATLWRNHGLIAILIRREVVGRYRGSVMGIVWSFLHPVLMLLVYTFVFSVVFNARWAGGSDSKMEFALLLFAGLLVFNVFAECVTRAPGLVLSNANYVKKIVFPLEVLGWVTMGAALFHAFVCLLVWLAFYVAFIGAPRPTLLLAPLVLTPTVLLALGISWAVASLGVYLRDTGQVVGVATTALLFLSPIFYPVAALPDGFRELIHLNPLASAIEHTRDVLFWGRLPRFGDFVASLGVSAMVAWCGFAWFQKTRKGFADVI